MSYDGHFLYYQADQTKDSLFYSSTEYPPVEHAIAHHLKLVQWKPSFNGIIAVAGDSLEQIMCISNENKISTIPLPVPAKQITILRRNRSEQKEIWALRINTGQTNIDEIYACDIFSKKVEKIAEVSFSGTLHLDSSLNIVAGHSTDEAGKRVVSYYDTNSASWIEIAAHPFDEGLFIGGLQQVLSVSEDGTSVFFTSNQHMDKNVLKLFHIPSKEIHMLAEDSLTDILPFGASVNKDEKVTSVVGLFAKTIRKIVDKAVEQDFTFLGSRLSGDIGFVDASDDDKKWLVREYSGGPTKYYLYEREKQKITYLLNEYPGLDSCVLAKRYPHTVMTKDSLSLPIHVYLPFGSDKNGDEIPDQPLPTVLFVHGGPWVGVVHWNTYFYWRNFQLLANRGYAVINCEFRGSTGFGKRFVDKSNKKLASDMLDDKVAIAEWAVEKGIARKQSIGIWGWSYGGYAAMAGITFSPKTFSCSLSMYGIADLLSISELPYFDTDLWRNRVGDITVSEDRKLLRLHSPINYIESITSPLFLTTGSLDKIIPQGQIDHMAEMMGKKGKDVVYTYYPEEGHDYMNPESWISFWAMAEQFLAKELGGNYESVKTDLFIGNYVVRNGKDFVRSLK